jgi:CubicO group peptidase (beta-lactamase class C family)
MLSDWRRRLTAGSAASRPVITAAPSHKVQFGGEAKMEFALFEWRQLTRTRLSWLCVLCLAVSPMLARAAPEAAPGKMTDAQIVQDLKSQLDRLVAEDRFSGTVLVAKNGEVLFEHAYGYADHAFNAPNKVDTKHNLGSMNKMFTATSILQLVQAGKLSLDDTLIKALPDYPDKDIAGKITIYQLLTHTSGLPDIFGDKYMNTPKDKLNTLEAHLLLFTGKPLLFEPGAKWSYNSAEYIVLGLVIQHISGKSYYDYVREHIYKPAGMINTGEYDIDDDVPNLALGYIPLGGKPGAPRKTNHFILTRGTSAGGGYSTAEDVLLFAEALQGGKLLNKEYTQLQMTGKISEGGPGRAKYGFGMEERVLNGVRIVGHSGGGPGIASNLDMYPDLGYTVVVMTNLDRAYGLVNDRLRMELAGQALPKAVQLSPEVLRALAGKYQFAPPPNAPPGMSFPPAILTADKEALLLSLGREDAHRFVPLSATEFFDEGSPNARLEFTRDAKGQITGLTLTGAGPEPMKAAKLP